MILIWSTGPKRPPGNPSTTPNGPAFLQGYAPVIVGYDKDGKWSTQKLYGEGTRNNVLGRTALNTKEYESLRNLGSAYVEITPPERTVYQRKPQH